MRGPLLVFILALTLILSGCVEGDERNDDDTTPEPTDDTNATAPEPNAVRLEVSLAGAYPVTIAYEPTSLQVTAGDNVTVVFTNDDQNPVANHDWVLEIDGSAGPATDVIGNGETDEVSFLAPAVGEYAFYCSVPGHRGNGMEGTFFVAAAAGGNATGNQTS